MDLFGSVSSSNYENGDKSRNVHAGQLHNPNLFFQERLLKYLGPIKKYTLPKSSKEKVQLESLNCDSLPPYRPKLFYLPEEDITVQRIVGYREIFKKHERIQYLREMEGEENYISNKTLYMSDWSRNFRLNEVAPGGGNQDKEKEVNHAEDHNHGSKATHNRRHSRHDSLAQHDHPDPDNRRNKRRKSAHRVSLTTGHHNLHKGHHRKKKRSKLQAKKIHEEIAEAVVHEPLKIEHAATTGVLNKKRMHTRDRIRHEKDVEWLQLSDSDASDEDGNIVKKKNIEYFHKPLMDWMVENLSHETQMLYHHLKWFIISAKIAGRQFWYTGSNFDYNLIDYLLSKKKMLIFILTTFVLWIILCCMILSILDINFSQKTVPQIRNKIREKQLDYIDYEAIEVIEFEKYDTLIYGIMIQAVTVGLWSVMVVLRDGLLISNYLNCWNAALTEMETSGVSGIKNVTKVNIIYFSVYALITVFCFAINAPRFIRESSGLVAMLVFRGISPTIRTRRDNAVLLFQIAGLFIHLYIVYCTRNLFTLIQIMALLLKNSAEMWNLKFGLYFSQFVFDNRGELLHVKLGYSLPKLFTHHRLICGLVGQFGIVFAWPISISLFLQMAVFTKCIVALIKVKIYTSKDFSDYKCIPTAVTFSRSAGENYHCLPLFLTRPEEYAMEIMVCINVLLDFFFNAEVISLAGQSFIDGYEFVRRTGCTLCTSSHQRRLIQSLEWSMAAASKVQLTATGLFTIDRGMIFAALATAFSFFSLIIQLTDIQIDVWMIMAKIGCGNKEVDDQGYCLYRFFNIEKVYDSDRTFNPSNT